MFIKYRLYLHTYDVDKILYVKIYIILKYIPGIREISVRTIEGTAVLQPTIQLPISALSIRRRNSRCGWDRLSDLPPSSMDAIRVRTATTSGLLC